MVLLLSLIDSRDFPPGCGVSPGFGVHRVGWFGTEVGYGIWVGVIIVIVIIISSSSSRSSSTRAAASTTTASTTICVIGIIFFSNIITSFRNHDCTFVKLSFCAVIYSREGG
jgi:hypothetical protein